MKAPSILIWILRLVAAVIMLQTLYFKFTGHEESVQLFSNLGMEPWGRIATGVFELIASILILYPRTTGFGSALGLGLMSGALFFHFTLLGLEVGGDYLLFIYAVTAFACCAILLFIFRDQILTIIKKRKLYEKGI